MPLRVRIHSSLVSMMRESFSFGTTFFGMRIPLPVITHFIDVRAYTARCLLLRNVIGGSCEKNPHIRARTPRVRVHAEAAGRDVSRPLGHLGCGEEGTRQCREIG